jgi:phospholipase/lecithinase/hemolysin
LVDYQDRLYRPNWGLACLEKTVKRTIAGGAVAVLSCLTALSHVRAHSFDALYAFGDSYTDSGAGYVDGNAPTAVVYLAKSIGIPFTYAGDSKSIGKSLNFAVSGAQTGSGDGFRIRAAAASCGIDEALFGRGMQTQVLDFDLRTKLPGVHVVLSHWGGTLDRVLENPSRYGISNASDKCAGRAVFGEDPTPCKTPDTYFYFHDGHPSTAVQKIVAIGLKRELEAIN